MATLLKAKGLYTFPNELSEIPQGALEEAVNVIIDRDGIIESRRGFVQYGNSFGTSANHSKQIFSYKDRVLSHYGDKLQYDSDGNGTFLDFDGSYSETENGLRVKSVEANSNFYFTTIDGVKKISATSSSDFTTSSGFITNSGGPKALDATASLNTSQSGFFPSNSAVAYRIVWGYRDANNNLILGSPSARTVITNPTPNSAVVDLVFTIPQDVTSTSFFYQVYRSGLTGITNTPSDEMNLVIEDFVTIADLAAGEVGVASTLTDITPDDFRVNGTLLYTNPVSGDGIAYANEKPPIAKDITSYKNHTFYSNTASYERLTLSLLSVDSLTSGVSSITISDGQTYTFTGVAEQTELTFDTVANTNDGGYFLINSGNNAINYFVWFDKTGSTAEPSGSDTLGRVAIPVDISGLTTDIEVANAVAIELDTLIDFNVVNPGTATITVTNQANGVSDDIVDGNSPVGGVFLPNKITDGIGEDSNGNFVLLSSLPTVGQAVDETAKSLVKIINKNSSSTVYAQYISGADDIPGQILLENRELIGARFNVIANDTTTGSEFSPSLPVSGTSVVSDNEVSPNRVYFSKIQQPEAVPLVNFIDIGPKDKEIKRIIGLRDSLFILKEDGVYRLTGDAGSFTVSLFDASAIILAPDSASVLNNQIYMLSSQGVVTVSDTGVQVVSRPIEDQIIKLTGNQYNFDTASFGVSYEEERAYHLFTVESTLDTVATRCFRWNTFTTSWVEWDITASSGLVTPDNNFYIGSGDINTIEKQRKNRDRTDYADREITLQLPANSVNGLTITLSSSSGLEAGDMITQTHYLTMNTFNRLLLMLDGDIYLNDTDYYSSLQLNSGDNLTNQMQLLVAKLNADNTNSTYIFSGTTDFQTIQTEYNTIITTLNVDSGVFRTNYKQSLGSVTFEMPLTEVIKNSNNVIIDYSSNLLVGDILVYKGIQTRIEWAPFTFGDPAILKHVRQGTVLFEDNLFRTAIVGYKSDLSPGFEDIEFTGLGSGAWGNFFWSEQNWGGRGNQTPLRTLIPRAKQRCRYLTVKFEHGNAYETFAILGISMDARAVSERAYR